MKSESNVMIAVLLFVIGILLLVALTGCRDYGVDAMNETVKKYNRKIK